MEARQGRANKDNGHLKPVWMNSHLNLGVAMGQGIDQHHWAANSLADMLATRAGASCQLPVAEADALEQSTAQVSRVLSRLGAIALYLAPSDRLDKGTKVARAPSKESLASKWALEAGHSLASARRCPWASLNPL